MAKASGTFTVRLAALDAYNHDPGANLGRMSIDKQFKGDLQAVSRGEMLSAGAPASGCAGYVAMECVTGTLHGRRGSLALQHKGTMDNGAQSLSVTVVPGSGTDELIGIEGAMTITIDDGQHWYQFDYTLAPAQ